MANTGAGIRLTFAQFAWGFAMLITVLGSWYDLKNRVSAVSTELAASEKRLAYLEARNENHGFTVEDASQLKDELLAEIRAEVTKVKRRIPEYRDAQRKPLDKPEWNQPQIYGR